MIQVYSTYDWYLQRPEPEQLWRGVMRRRTAPVGPASRAALTHMLESEGAQLPVYTANVEPQLEPFVGQRVRVRGKLVDLTNEGFGKELWIGSIGAD